jgi:ABC-type amino acid transport substrate-binding protein
MGLQLLKFKAVDLIIIDKPVAESFARLNQNMEVAGTIETNESYGFVVQEGDPQGLLPVINQILAEMKKNGEYDQLIDQWFGGVSQ